MDLISLPVEIEAGKVDARYRLAIAVAKRARKLYQGTQPTIDSKAKKMSTIALEEIVSGSVIVLMGEDAVKAKAEAGKLTYEEMMDEAKQKASLPEDISELEKDLKVYLREKEQKSSKATTEEIFPKKSSV
ncbi:DNA-directed RNA polymerase subunit omega [bacterium BMS3Abin10]|nr:DNA-directed RNA polymerase subunit omega [bacterium BMS3Abin10]GBE38605.1 DNA-directed RNA polymerase subunit omega [bacterium BMS3Bbin08]HDH51025.1 DNA-directed RNA polymerase subunit omega [Nitrospirota bacterium]HDK17250.1 DNA-directed RNA polymerase subunit omega [Nitrospirota bacterium]